LFSVAQAVNSPPISLAEAIYKTINDNLEPDRRLPLVENIIVTGGCANIKGIRERLEYECAPYLAASETSNEFQPKEIKFPKIPEYMTSYKETFPFVTYLGCTVVAKVNFDITCPLLLFFN
jgi:actin-related protein